MCDCVLTDVEEVSACFLCAGLQGSLCHMDTGCLLSSVSRCCVYRLVSVCLVSACAVSTVGCVDDPVSVIQCLHVVYLQPH